MIKILIILIFLVYISCEELVVQNWIGNYSDGEQTFKTYQRTEWNNVLDVAVYGWFKIKSSLSRANYPNLFQLTQNNIMQTTKQIGERVLGMWVQNNIIEVSTYSLPSSSDVNTMTLSFTSSDMDVWNFFYYSYGSIAKKAFVYLKFYSTGVKTYQFSNITHYTSNFYRIYVGQSKTSPYFPGAIHNLFIKFGSGAYKEDNFNSFMIYNPNDPAPNMLSDINSKLKITYNTQDADIEFILQC